MPAKPTKRVVHSRYGCFWECGDRRYASRNEELETPASVRRWVSETVVRLVKAREALLAEGKVSRVGRVKVLSVYDNPYHSDQSCPCPNAQCKIRAWWEHCEYFANGGALTVKRPREMEPTNLSVETVLDAIVN